MYSVHTVAYFIGGWSAFIVDYEAYWRRTQSSDVAIEFWLLGDMGTPSHEPFPIRAILIFPTLLSLHFLIPLLCLCLLSSVLLKAASHILLLWRVSGGYLYSILHSYTFPLLLFHFNFLQPLRIQSGPWLGRFFKTLRKIGLYIEKKIFVLGFIGPVEAASCERGGFLKTLGISSLASATFTFPRTLLCGVS